MTITYDATPVTVNPPEFGYTVRIHLSTHWGRQSDNSWKVWDDTASYDFRTLECRWIFNETEANNFVSIFTDAAKGRGENVTITPSTGFFPAGPDKGDAGNFTARLLSISQPLMIMAPVKYFVVNTEFSFNGSFPSYALPSQVSEGNLTIGTITNLRYPDNEPSTEVETAVKTHLAFNGTPYSIDSTVASDAETVTFPMIMNESKAAALMNHLVSTVRGNEVDLVPPSNSYIFGREAGSTDTYTCLFPQSEIAIIHAKHDRYLADLTFYYNE